MACKLRVSDGLLTNDVGVAIIHSHLRRGSGRNGKGRTKQEATTVNGCRMEATNPIYTFKVQSLQFFQIFLADFRSLPKLLI